MKRATAIFLALAVLALGGLSAALLNLKSQPTEIAAGPTHVTAGEIIPPAAQSPDVHQDPASAAASARTTDPEKWSADVMQAFLDSYERKDFSEFSDGTPHQRITDWTATPNGSLTVVLENDYYIEARVRWLALEIMKRGGAVDQLQSVTVQTEDGSLSRTVSGSDT